ncbi:hypothetical protein CkaCkLH20_05028 [Colletotrichum karsti]|uniref:Serine/threonine-protein kinase Tel1 n=1 Tax=Colletotrichum karsti TaxID=1095194 RepID=A0A9P6I4T5_9PEZI|nr:uncharacterized protein CkaCkLH20_05028 [Colletotrichum karsti]KAF9877328.1 hypothetical protein CkaCkLH20_05028 [Colletotrichum karsti]
MAPPKIKTGEVTVNDALDAISGGTLKERGSGLDDLIFLLDKRGKTTSLSSLGDKHYHRIFDSLFRCALTEKQSYLGGKRTTAAAAGSRLSKCAEALRLAANHGASKLKRKTILAVIDHITQTLPGPDEYLEPLLKDYVKSLIALLSHQSNGEHLATLGAEGWLACVDFCTEAISRYLENADRDSGSPESSFASLNSVHLALPELINLIRACCGAALLVFPSHEAVSGGPICQTWKAQYHASALMRFLLLLEEPKSRKLSVSSCIQASASTELIKASDSSTFHASKKLVLELLFPKIEGLQVLCDFWTKKGSEGGTQISSDKLHSLFSAVIVGTTLVPQLTDLNSDQSRDIESTISKLSDSALSAALEADDNQTFFEILFQIIRPVLPSFEMTGIDTLLKDSTALFRLAAKLAETYHERASRQSSGQNSDLMDLDDEFDSQESKASAAVKSADLPRLSVSISLDSTAFHHATAQRLYFLESMRKDSGNKGRIPQDFLDQFLSLPHDEFLMCGLFSSELFASNLAIGPDDALQVIEKLGAIIGEAEYTCCEVAHSTVLSILEGLIHIWSDEKHEISTLVGDIYNYFVRASLPKNSLSPKSQMSLASLLLSLLRHNPQYGSNLGISSCRTTLLSILQEGTLGVKHFIGSALPEIFGFYVLKTHEEMFLDVLNSLPTDPEFIEGIAFRLFVLSQLACRWPTLLRRCIYHIFETPGKIAQSTKYAKTCLQKVSEALHLTSPQELFDIFQPQLLYTWLEVEAVENIPFDIFGFASLDALVREGQAEIIALEIMRGRYDSVRNLSQRLGTPLPDLVKQCFTRIMAYTIAHESSTSASESDGGEAWVRKLLGRESFLDHIYLNFADVVGLLIDTFDQEDPIEKYLARDQNFDYAATNIDQMKNFSQSTTPLPPNQQPMFRAKFLLKELFHLCSKTEYELHDLWTPALVVAVARKLLNTVHPALGSLHACSVLRKLRVVIALAGSTAIEAYPLEMLLSSIRPFLVDSECADDALGVSRYLITNGTSRLLQAPSFLAGYALSTLASLRVFLESSQSSTTQESQFKATKTKAQQFHSWFSQYLAGYESSAFEDECQNKAFRSITQSASNIRSSGNAEKGTHESTLLLEILKDGEREKQLLNEAARDLALGMLCGDFVIPSSSGQDVIENDIEAIRHTGLVWKSCNALSLSDEYLAWAGRVVGRSFAASGEIQPELLRESEVSLYDKLASGSNNSEKGLLSLLQKLTQSKDSAVAGLAESALRAIVSEAASQEDNALLVAAEKTLTESLCKASAWRDYRIPPSDYIPSQIIPDSQVFFREHVESPEWIQDLAVHLAHSVPEYIILGALVRILEEVKGFAQDAFPFIVHLALYSQVDKQHTIKRNLSEAAKEWLKVQDDSARTNQKQLINTILYLRTQKLPKEASIADRAMWLDVDFTLAASAASRCGMYKTALLFTEIAASQISRSSRRSSAVRDEESSDVLLSIFENIDDPDAYYGLPQPSDLSSVLSRLEYEKDGSKLLAFRGAQYDDHIQNGDPGSRSDSQSLVRALGTLGLAGLSYSIQQTQQSHNDDEDTLANTFQTARRLERWNLPAPTSADNHAVTIYKAYQNIQQAADPLAVRSAIYDGFSQTMRNLVTNRGLNAAKLRKQLGALAVLTELDDAVNLADFSELEGLLAKFEQRCQWMRRGRYEDVSHILSCRGTTLSLISQQPELRNTTPAEARQVEIRCKLMSSGIYRYHQATQESLNVSTSLTSLIIPCETLGLKVDAAIKIEAANSLWDHGEMIHSIRMLQGIDNDSSLKKQTIPVSRSDLLSKIGHQVSVARLEKPHHIQKNYLEPALKELKGKSQGQQAGHVFHQFASFCDGQLQSQDGLEDLARLRSLKKGKSDEVAQLQSLIATCRDSQMKNRYQSHLKRATLWLHIDEQELRRVEQTRSEFVKLSVENYLLSLTASDEHDNDALRFTALWLERSDEEAVNEAVKRHLDKVPTRKFATLMNQLSSRLQNQPNLFQKLLINLVYNICVDHPYHGMYQIWSGTKVKTRKEDQVAVLRQQATERVAGMLQTNKAVASIWQAIDRTSNYYHRLAIDKENPKFKAGHKIALKDIHSASSLINALLKYQIPPPTMQIEVAADRDYSKVPTIARLEPQMSIASGVSAPKIITAIGTDGEAYRQLVKGGNDDLRQDAIMEQVFAAVSVLLKLDRSTQQRHIGIRTYKVLPLTSASGLIEFVPHTIPLHEFLMPAHERYFPKDLKGSQCRKEIANVESKTAEYRINTYRKVTERFHPVMKYFFMEYFMDPDEWFAKRLAYTRTTAAISMLGHVLGLGDRHGHNILLDKKTGEVVHIDLGVAFEMGRVLPVPETVPFRLTRDIVDGMGVTGTEGVFRRCCEFTLHAMREETYSIMTILDVLRYDPLYSWSISPTRLAKLQGGLVGIGGGDDDGDVDIIRKTKKVGGLVNEPSEADRALEVVRKKLSKTLSVTATVNDLINQATDIGNLAVLYSVAPHQQQSPSRPSPKRFRFGVEDSPNSNMSTKMKGKLPEVVDLTQTNSSQPYSRAKKLVIKNLRQPAKNEQLEQYYKRTEQELLDALQDIFNGRKPQLPLERLYRAVEDICRRGNSNDLELYEILRRKCEEHLTSNVLRSIKSQGGTTNVDMLRSVHKHWRVWNSQIIMIRSTFSYLDRTFLLKNKSYQSINDLTISQFRRMTFPSREDLEGSSPGGRALRGMYDLISYDRTGDERFDASLLKESVMMLHVFNNYTKLFEPRFIDISAEYFLEFAEERSSSSLKEYILACERLLKREDYRCNEYNLDSTTKKQLLDAAHSILVNKYSEKLLNGDSLSKLLAENEVESLKALYDLLRLSGIQKKLKEPWSAYIRKTGTAIVADKEHGDDMVRRLLELKRALSLIVRDSYGGDADFVNELRNAFGDFMNDRSIASTWSSGTSKVGEMIAKYVDMLLRGGLKALPKALLSDNKDRAEAEQSGQASTGDEDAELDRQLDQALELFRFIEGKDAFEAFYKKDLARRLLMGRSASQDAERNMLRKLRDECGSNFTHNLEQMFKDVEVAKEEMEAYKLWSEGSGAERPPVDLSVMILSAAAWPTYPDVRVNVPDDVAKQIERFDQYYKNKHTGRLLNWKHALAHCTVKAKFPKGTKELLVSAYQAIVLVLFNEVGLDGFLAHEQIARSTNLQGDELKRTLQSLACGQVRVLSKHPKGKDINPEDTFSINKAFQHPKIRVKINQIQLKETKDENKATHERIAQDRRFETQAAIVRIMKSRKTMSHGELVAEVINMTKNRGAVDAAQIKKEIENLIDKDYLEREGNTYTYLA